MGKNAQRRRRAKQREKYMRSLTVSNSRQLSQLAIENDVPNRAARRQHDTPTWYTTSRGPR